MYPIITILSGAGTKKTALNPVEDFILNHDREYTPPSKSSMNSYCGLLTNWLTFMRKTIPAQPYGTTVFFRTTRHLYAWAYDAMYPHRDEIKGFDKFEKLLFDTYNSYADLSVDCSNADECLLAERQAILIAVEAVKHCRQSMEAIPMLQDEILDYAICLLSSIQHKTDEQRKALRDARLLSGRYDGLTVDERTSIMQTASIWLANSEYDNKGALLTVYWDFLCSELVDYESEEPEEVNLAAYCDCVRSAIYLETPEEIMTHETWIASGAEFCTDLVEECVQLAEDEQTCLGVLARLNYKWATGAISEVNSTFGGRFGSLLEKFYKITAKLRMIPYGEH